MKTTIIKIGNSRGIRLPKSIIEQCGFKDEVELEIDGNRLIIKPANRPRKNWEKFFKSADKNEKLLIDLPPSEWDNQEWEW